jgi:hypothetical protein
MELKRKQALAQLALRPLAESIDGILALSTAPELDKGLRAYLKLRHVVS